MTHSFKGVCIFGIFSMNDFIPRKRIYAILY